MRLFATSRINSHYVLMAKLTFMTNSQNNIIHTGYRKMPEKKIRVPKGNKVESSLKYPINELGEPRDGLNDSLAICQYSKQAMIQLGAYIRQVIRPLFPSNEYVMRKEDIDGTPMVLIYRTR